MFDVADMSWQAKCREEDLKQRALENERRAIDDARRLVDEKAQQLKTLAHQSALIAGFCMISLVEMNSYFLYLLLKLEHFAFLLTFDVLLKI